MLGRAEAIAVLASLGTVVTGGLALLGMALAWRAPDVATLAAAIAKVWLLATTVASPVFHPWYLIPCLVLSVELRDPVWQSWLRRFAPASLIVDGALLFARGSLAREVFTVLAVATVAALSLLDIRRRVAGLLLPRGTPPR